MVTHDENERRVRTTVSLPESVLSMVDQFIASSRGQVTSRAEFLERALRGYLAELDRRRIDEAFAGMASDESYQTQARRIADEFEASEDAI